MGSWVKRPNDWHWGIPNFIGLYTYFKELQTADDDLPSARRQHGLWAHASNQTDIALDSFQMPENIEKANQFLALVAENERAKELNMIKTFCKQTGENFPLLLPYLNTPSLIDGDLDNFYVALTAAINEVRKSSMSYHNELLRIQQNLSDASRTLKSYKEDDYRYRLNGDITSFLNRITGNFKVVNDETDTPSFAQQVQTTTLRILEKMNISEKLKSAEDFAAIAAATLIDVERQVQEELDKKLQDGYSSRKKLDEQIDKKILSQIEKRYENLATKTAIAESPVEKALSNINSIEFTQIVNNAKEILNIKTLPKTEKEIKLLNDRVRQRDNRAKNKNKQLYEARQQVKALFNSKELNLLTFNIEGSFQSQHGNIYELVESIFNDGFKVSGNMATDIMTYSIGWNTHQDNTVLANLTQEIGKIYTDAYTELQHMPSNEIRNTQDILTNMNQEISHLIQLSEKKMKELGELKLDDIFIFHETLKLSSSAETGRNKQGGGFSGREMSIMSYIDSLYTLSDSIDMPLDRTMLGFLALNLVPGAVAQKAKEPLEQYLSLYAGMVMFDDIANMGKEAINMINAFPSTNGKIVQIHLYNLNGLYVPASMMLSYISEAVNNTAAQITANAAAKATITAKTNDTYGQYLTLRRSNEPFNLTPATWSAVAATSASNTKIKITFLASFKAFVEKLYSSI